MKYAENATRRKPGTECSPKGIPGSRNHNYDHHIDMIRKEWERTIIIIKTSKILKLLRITHAVTRVERLARSCEHYEISGTLLLTNFMLLAIIVLKEPRTNGRE